VNWRNVTVAASQESVERLESCFWALGAVSVTVRDAGDDPLYEPGVGETPMWSSLLVVGLFEDDVDPGQIELGMKRSGFEVLASEPLADREWERVWLDDFRPMRYGERMWICPTGHSVTEPGAIVMHLDPGLAFGSGTHATTRLCLEWLDRTPLAGMRVLDFGCGSGVLGIAAGLLGAEEVLGIDNDPQALVATRDNARRNGINVTALPPSSLPPAPHDIVLANILAQPLIELGSLLVASTRPGGDLVISGIMTSQRDWVAGAYADLTLKDEQHLDGWLLLHFSPA
jgi:ribosomal protein L11 methyltransferase